MPLLLPIARSLSCICCFVKVPANFSFSNVESHFQVSKQKLPGWPVNPDLSSESFLHLPTFQQGRMTLETTPNPQGLTSTIATSANDSTASNRSFSFVGFFREKNWICTNFYIQVKHTRKSQKWRINSPSHRLNPTDPPACPGTIPSSASQ